MQEGRVIWWLLGGFQAQLTNQLDRKHAEIKHVEFLRAEFPSVISIDAKKSLTDCLAKGCVQGFAGLSINMTELRKVGDNCLQSIIIPCAGTQKSCCKMFFWAMDAFVSMEGHSLTALQTCRD